MAFDISEISGEIASAGILRSNKFDVIFTPPQLMLTAGISSLSGIEKVVFLYCENANIPGIVMDVAPIRRYGYGPMQKKPFAPTFNDASLVFRSDAGGALWKYLHSWFRMVLNYQEDQGLGAQTGIIPLQHPFELGYLQDYATDITITAYDDTGAPSIVTVLRQAYPIFIGDIQMAWEAKNEYVRIPATFTFIDWYHLDANPIQAQAQSNITPV